MNKIIAVILASLIFAILKSIIGFEATVIGILSVLIINQKSDND